MPLLCLVPESEIGLATSTCIEETTFPGAKRERGCRERRAESRESCVTYVTARRFDLTQTLESTSQKYDPSIRVQIRNSPMELNLAHSTVRVMYLFSFATIWTTHRSHNDYDSSAPHQLII
jgi:hypothetical protein